MEKFNYDYRYCPICESKMMKKGFEYPVLKCKNNCCEYNVFRREEVVQTKLFSEEKTYLLTISEYYTPRHRNLIGELSRDEKEFLNRVKYWRENDRYLAKIMGVD